MAAKPERTAAHLSREQVVTQLRMAKEAIKRSGFIVGSPKWTSSDFQALELFNTNEQYSALSVALDEVTPDDYNGPHPPNHLSKEPKCSGLRMLQFAWSSRRFGSRRMYLKFCLSDNRFVLIRLHSDYQPNKFDG